MEPTSRTEPLIMGGSFPRVDGAVHPHHPRSYEIGDPAEAAEVRALQPPHREEGADEFECMCWEDSGRVVVTPEWIRLLDPLSPDGIPARHRARWAAAAPAGLRAYAEALAAGEEEPDLPRGVPLGVVFSWMGAVRKEPRDAAWLLAERGPQRLLAGAATDELAWAVRETDRAGLEGAVRFFVSEEFTTRHPKRRRVGDTSRDLLLRHARSHRPQDLPVLERRLLRAPEDRVRRS
ncbi:hypothetical protein OG429_29460 [Streptomyces sp. NBC_00190]|uniref:hypothetical protein n=1 Tax=unclassified Streptomyces TaxID=2593676 RepID=UPI002E2A9A66|nr:hypothetical protein [Streptomyces sp. NBC_00190]WSZ43054.1 hypothetical protein OG239_32105 [Streptomyces sp. NBC_00868]